MLEREWRVCAKDSSCAGKRNKKREGPYGRREINNLVQ